MSVHKFSKVISLSIISLAFAAGLTSAASSDQSISVSITAVPGQTVWLSEIDSPALRETVSQQTFVVEVMEEFDDLPGLARAFQEAVNGSKICLAACVELGNDPITIEGDPSTSDALRILMATKYGLENSADYRWNALRRIDDVISRVGADRINLEGKDKVYLTGPFRQIVERTMSAAGQDFPNVVALIERGFDGKTVKLDAINREFEPYEFRELDMD